MFENDVRNGTVEGTGSAINISCGFKPRMVDIINIDGDCNGYFNDQGMAAGEIYKILTTSGVHALMASGGITKWAGEAPGAAITGTNLTIAAGSLSLSITSGAFSTELVEGDVIRAKNSANTVSQHFTVVEVTSNTAIIVGEECKTAFTTGSTAIRMTGRDPGFTIGADGDLNVSGQTICWRAFR